MGNANLLLRLYAELADAEEAEQLRCAITPQIEAHARIEEHESEPYWKIPAYYGLTLRLRPYGDPSMAFDNLVALSASGWTFSGGPLPHARDAVWNPSPGADFLSPKVKWAHLDLWYSQDEEQTGTV